MHPWTIMRSPGPLIATAIHAGHQVRPSLLPHLALPADERLREEDPHTNEFLFAGDTRIDVAVSRFEVDLNRPRESAVYTGPDCAWGLDVWREPLSASEHSASLALYDRFYADLGGVIEERVAAHGQAVVLDLHSYNHRRDGPTAPPADPAANPVLNVGTKAADRERWGGVIDQFLHDVCRGSVAGSPLDARENVKFGGGHMSRWIASRFGADVLVLCLEFKKVFMDEWTGALHRDRLDELRRAVGRATTKLRATINGT